MKTMIVALALLSGASLLGSSSMAQAQRLSISPTAPTQISITKFAEDLKRHLESLGYTSVTLTPSDKGIKGLAMKGDRKVEIIFDEKGQLRVIDPV